MNKRLTCIFLSLVTVLACMPIHPRANEITSPTSDTSNDSRASQSTSAIVLQGNTQSASDCKVFRDELMSTGYGYSMVTAYGWNTTTGNANQYRITDEDLRLIEIYPVAYYSGHGGTTTSSGTRHPVLNYIPTNTNNDYGISDPIDVATTFGVDSSNWSSTCTLNELSALKVLILSACSQLDSSVVKYYARLMKASNIRVIAGYHATAPGTGIDDQIAEDFIAEAADGSSIWLSWKTANNYGNNWAILVYEENANQYFRIPGFPGNTYAPPSSTAKIYRYADFLSDDANKRDETPASISFDDDLALQILSLPLTITTLDFDPSTYALPRTRETVCSNLSIADTDAIAEYLWDTFGDDLSEKLCVQHYIAREEISVELGSLPETETILARRYDYYDTYLGIKIADSYVGASIDCEGIHNIIFDRKNVVSAGDTISEAETYSARSITVISESEAVAIAQADNSCYNEFVLWNVALAYAPTENGVHVLCYEITSPCGFCYVNVQTGDIIRWI